MRGTGALIVIGVSALELSYIAQHFSLLTFYSSAVIFLVFILYILLAISSFVSIGKFISPIIGIIVILVRVSSTYTSLGAANFMNTFLNAFNLSNPTSMFATTWIAELFIGGGYFLMFLGAIPGRGKI